MDNAKEAAEYQGQHRAVQGAPNFREHAEPTFIHVPGGRGKKTQAIPLYGRSGFAPDLQEVHSNRTMVSHAKANVKPRNDRSQECI